MARFRAGNPGGSGAPRGLELCFVLRCHWALCSVMQRSGERVRRGRGWGLLHGPELLELLNLEEPSGTVAILALLSAQAFPHTDISIHSGEHRGQGHGQVGGDHFQT